MNETATTENTKKLFRDGQWRELPTADLCYRCGGDEEVCEVCGQPEGTCHCVATPDLRTCPACDGDGLNPAARKRRATP